MLNNRQLVVIKLGGHAMTDQKLLGAFLKNIASLAQKGLQLVIVHGGGPHISNLLFRLNIPSTFIEGLRVTDAETLEAVEMVLCGSLNKALTRALLKAGANASGISGEDGGLLRATMKNEALGLVGSITAVNPGIIHTLLAAGFVPVVAPLALGPDFQPLNVNADTAAGALAGALQADFFILVSDVPGVLDKTGNLLPELERKDVPALLGDGTISGGMIPKVECCLEALAKGCRNALILDGKQQNSLLDFLEKGIRKGTVLK